MADEREESEESGLLSLNGDVFEDFEGEELGEISCNGGGGFGSVGLGDEDGGGGFFLCPVGLLWLNCASLLRMDSLVVDSSLLLLRVTVS